MADVLFDAIVVIADNCSFENSYHLSLLKEDLNEFCGGLAFQICSHGSNELTLCLWKASALRSPPLEGGLFVAANILQNLPTVITSETTSRPPLTLRTNKRLLTLYSSALFCSVFGLLNQERVVFRLCANVPEIDRVVIGAATDDAFRWASGESFRTELKDIMSKQTLLCMVGCNFGIHAGCFPSESRTFLWEQLTVVSCIPVCQGRLTEASEIVVKCYSQQHNMCRRHEHGCTNCNSSHSDDVAEAVMVSDFAADIANKCNLQASSSRLDICLNRFHQNVPTHELNFTVFVDVNRMKSLISFHHSQDVSDEFSVALFSRQCASRLGILNGNMLEVSCKLHGQQRRDSRSSSVCVSETHQRVCRQKVLIACVDTTDSGDDVVACMSSCAWFNLCSISSSSPSGNCAIHPFYVKVRDVCMIICKYYYGTRILKLCF